MHLYFDVSILQQKHFTGCQVYAYEMLKEMIALSPETTFHLHFGMQDWNDQIDNLLMPENVVQHRVSGPLGRSIGLPLNILKTRSQALYIMNGLSGGLRVPVPCPSVALIHDLRNVLYPEIYGFEEQKRYKARASKWMHQRDLIFTGTETVKNEIISHFQVLPEKIVVASEATDHHDIDAPDSRPESIPEHVPYFLMFNMGSELKNWRLVIEAFKIYVEAHPEDLVSLLVLAGSVRGEGEHIRQALSASPAVEARTIITGYITDEELRYLYRNGRLLLFPSRYEGFGIPTLEAMGQRLPVLLSDIPVFREVARDAALYVSLDNAPELAEGIHRLNSDEQLRSTLIQRGMERVGDYSWRKSAEKTLEVLLKLASKR